jgi:hypothetical protein
LEDLIVEGLAFHHCPSKYQGRGFSPLVAVHVANALEHQANGTDSKEFMARIEASRLTSLKGGEEEERPVKAGKGVARRLPKAERQRQRRLKGL